MSMTDKEMFEMRLNGATFQVIGRGQENRELAKTINDYVDLLLETEKRKILSLPKADTERHAHWVEQADGNLPLCSNCLEECTFYKLFDIETETSECVTALTDFCPHCGCKMTRWSNDLSRLLYS